MACYPTPSGSQTARACAAALRERARLLLDPKTLVFGLFLVMTPEACVRRFMSTTTDRNVAMDYAGGQQASHKPHLASYKLQATSYTH